MGKFDTHGGYFAPAGFLKINEGGKHSQNPNGGVQIGTDRNGVPNMVEEDESIYRDFVYSDNIVADKSILKKYKLPEKFAGKKYSDIADWYLKEAELRPNDQTSTNGLNAMLSRLAAAQEMQKAEEQKAQMLKELKNMPPEELMAMQQAEQQAAQQQQIAMDQQQAAAQQQAMPEQAAMQQMVPQQMMRCGGKIRKFTNGGGILLRDPYDDREVSTYEDTPAYNGGQIEPAVVTAYPGKSREWVQGQVNNPVASAVREGRNAFISDAIDAVAEASTPLYFVPGLSRVPATLDLLSGDTDGAVLAAIGFGRANKVSRSVKAVKNAARIAGLTKSELKEVTKRTINSHKKTDPNWFQRNFVPYDDREVSTYEDMPAYNGGQIEPAVVTAYPGKSREWVQGQVNNPVASAVREGRDAFISDAIDAAAEASTPLYFVPGLAGVPATLDLLSGDTDGAVLAAIGFGRANKVSRSVKAVKNAARKARLTKSKLKEVTKRAINSHKKPDPNWFQRNFVPYDRASLNVWPFMKGATKVFMNYVAPVGAVAGAGTWYASVRKANSDSNLEVGDPSMSTNEDAALREAIGLPPIDYENDTMESNYANGGLLKNYYSKGGDTEEGTGTNTGTNTGTGTNTTGRARNKAGRYPYGYLRDLGKNNDVYTREYDDFWDFLNENPNSQMATQLLSDINSGKYGDIGGNTFKFEDLKDLYRDYKEGPVHRAFRDYIDKYAEKMERRRLVGNKIVEQLAITNPISPMELGNEAVTNRAVTEPLGRTVYNTKSTGNGRHLPVYTRYAGVLGSGLLAAQNLLQQPDRYQVVPVAPITPYGEMRQQYARYNPLDINMGVNATLSQANAGARNQRLLGLNPGTSAALLAADYNATRGIGSNYATFVDANNQQRNNVIAMNNQAAANKADFDARMSQVRSQILNDAAYQGQRMNLGLQQMNNDAESQKYAAFSQNLSNMLQGFSGIGTENFNFNMLNDNDALFHALTKLGLSPYKGADRIDNNNGTK